MKNEKSKLILVLAGILALCSCGSKETKETKGVTKPAVKTFVLQEEQAQGSINLPGDLKPFEEVDIYAKVNSFVKEVPVDRGSVVNKGQTLLVLDAPEIQSQMAEAASKLKTKEAVLRSSKSSYLRLLETSKTQGAVSPNDLDVTQSKMMADSSEVSSARSNYKAMADIQSYLTVTAPFDGVVSERNIHPGAFVGPGGKGSDKPLLKLEQENVLRLIVAIPEKFTGSLHVNDEVKFTVQSYPGITFTAKVSRMSGSIEPKTRSEMIEMDVINKDKKLLPGMYAQVQLNTMRNEKTFVVPNTAVLNSTEGIYIIKVENGKVKRVLVTKGASFSNKTEVFGQLTVGDKIVLEASENLRDADSIDVQ